MIKRRHAASGGVPPPSSLNQPSDDASDHDANDDYDRSKAARNSGLIVHIGGSTGGAAAVGAARRSSVPIVVLVTLLLGACLAGVVLVGGAAGGSAVGGGGSFGPSKKNGQEGHVRKVRDAAVLGALSAPEADVPPKIPREKKDEGKGVGQWQKQQQESEKKGEGGRLSSSSSVFDVSNLQTAVQTVRKEYATRYGGADASSSMFQRGIRTFYSSDGKNKKKGDGGGALPTKDESTQHTALRILRAASNSDPTKRQFVASFGGYSVTVGRGNHFSQSYPFVMERVLTEPLKRLGVELVVRNAAIGGIPSFPYGFCLPNFLGPDSDVISWDYSMNEGNDSAGLEAYIRHGMNLPKRPMVVVLDTKRSRMDLMRKYVELGVLVDPIAISREGNVVDKALMARKEEDRPEGLTRWDEWGSPPGSPGQSSWHPKFREHELMGWNLAVHLLEAVEAAGRIMAEEPDWRVKHGFVEDGEGTSQTFTDPISLPPPLNKMDESVRSIFHGSEQPDGKWQMKAVSCRTTFQPVVSGPMRSIIVSGVAEDDGDAMKSRPDSKYATGWVVDVGKVERDTKRKVEKSGGMGYIDMKLALYGIPGSGPVRLWLPYEGSRRPSAEDGGEEDKASDWFNSIVICEVNEKRGPKECRMDADVSYTVGGVDAVKGISKLKSVASYLKKEVCVTVNIPEGATITRRKHVTPLEGDNNNPKSELDILSEGSDNDVGIILDVQVTGKAISRKEGACSISHVVWDQV